jgi:hypothetical protein
MLVGKRLGRPEGNSTPHGLPMTLNLTWSEDRERYQSLLPPDSSRRPSGAVRPAGGLSASNAGSVGQLDWIIAELLPADIAEDVMTRRGTEVQQLWESLISTPLYEELTVWVMAAWPDQMVERVDTMVRTAIASADRVRQGEWTTERLIGVVRKAGQRAEHRAVHQHLGHQVRIVSFDDALIDLEAVPVARANSCSLGQSIVSNLRVALGEHRYMVTPSAAALLDRSCDIAVDHLDSVRARTVSAERAEGLLGLDLFAAARPTRRANKSNRIIEVFRDLPHATGVSLSHLLLGTDHHPEAALLWRHASGLSPAEVPAEIVKDWRAELVALTPAILAFSERRRRRLRDRSRRGDNLRRVFEQTLDGELAGEDVSLAR